MKAKNYFQINTMEVKQFQTGIVLLGKLTFKELLKIHRLTERKESLIDPFDEKKVDISREDEEFQRQLSESKLNKIVSYLKEPGVSRGLFPTTMLVALDYESDYIEEEITEDFLSKIYLEDLKSCLINQERTKLFIPKNSRIALIVDGQHRFYGVKKYYDSLTTTEDKRAIEEFEFVTTFLIGFDIYEVGKIFATVNFTQKPVNRSLYYDIFGAVPDTERNEIKLAHDLALHLNNNPVSPINGMIKMLGKGYGLFSQAFFVEKMLIHFRGGGVWEKIYADYLSGGKEYRKLPDFMKIYLSCIKEKYKTAWPQKVERDGKKVYSPYKYDFILCKTSGMGAIFRLIREIFPIVEDFPAEKMQFKIASILERMPENKVVNIFSKDGEFGGAGAEGLQLKLYKKLKLELGF